VLGLRCAGDPAVLSETITGSRKSLGERVFIIDPYPTTVVLRSE
jgi:hypothetical protein